MKIRTEPTHTVHLYLSGPIEVAKQVIREHVHFHPQCVTIEPTTYLYTGGEEQGYVVGLLNYPRFPATPNEINTYAEDLAKLLVERTFQHSALIVTPTETTWVTTRKAIDALASESKREAAETADEKPDGQAENTPAQEGESLS